MARESLNTLQFSCIQIAIALLLFTQAKSTTDERTSHPNNTITSCIADERSSLLAFRAGLSDPANLLSSWKGDDCCRWKGVHCSNRTNHVFKLDLRGPDWLSGHERPQVLAGNISSSLLGLQHLRYLDLSQNGFDKIQIPEFMGSLHKLIHLDLSWSLFIGKIPPQLGNLSNLRYLNLEAELYDGTYSTDITWLSRLTSLEHLDMSEVNLSTIVHWLPVVNMLPALKVLRLFGCQLRNSPDSLQLTNLTSLETLDLSANDFHKRSTPNWFWDLSGLKHLDISSNGFYGPFPDEIGNMTSVVEFDLSDNNLVGMIPSSMKNLCNLERLSSCTNNINGSITELFQRLPSCSQNKLQMLFLLDTNLTGSLPTTLVEPLRNLSWLDLCENKLTGHVPLWIGELTQLTTLMLNSNNLDGVIHEGHLSRLPMLEKLALSDNSIAITVSPAWVPPFSLNWIELRSCNLGPKFPMWLRWQTHVSCLDISNTSIYQAVDYTKIPEEIITLVELTILNLSWNNFNGKIPKNIGALMQMESLDLSHNDLSGEIPSSLSSLTYLSSLNLSYNNLRGKIPTVNQLYTFEDPASVFIGNPGLCGPPLSINCSSQPEPVPGENYGDASDDLVSFFLSMGSGYVMGLWLGLWVVFCTFLFKRRWRISWYLLCDSMYDWVYVQVAVTWNSLRGKIN